MAVWAEGCSLLLAEYCCATHVVDRVMNKIFGPKKDEVTREWRRLHDEELYAVYSSSGIIWVIKSRRLRWSGRVARMGRGQVLIGFSGET
jgi:hypothetical protein